MSWCNLKIMTTAMENWQNVMLEYSTELTVNILSKKCSLKIPVQRVSFVDFVSSVSVTRSHIFVFIIFKTHLFSCLEPHKQNLTYFYYIEVYYILYWGRSRNISSHKSLKMFLNDWMNQPFMDFSNKGVHIFHNQKYLKNSFAQQSVINAKTVYWKGHTSLLVKLY